MPRTDNGKIHLIELDVSSAQCESGPLNACGTSGRPDHFYGRPLENCHNVALSLSSKLKLSSLLLLFLPQHQALIPELKAAQEVFHA